MGKRTDNAACVHAAECKLASLEVCEWGSVKDHLGKWVCRCRRVACAAPSVCAAYPAALRSCQLAPDLSDLVARCMPNLQRQASSKGKQINTGHELLSRRSSVCYSHAVPMPFSDTPGKIACTSRTQVCTSAVVPLHPYTSVPLYRSASKLMCLCISKPLCVCTSVPLHQQDLPQRRITAQVQ